LLHLVQIILFNPVLYYNTVFGIESVYITVAPNGAPAAANL